MKNNIIEITVKGVTQIGKSAVLAEIKKHLESKNMAVVFSDREHRNNPPGNFDQCPWNERPNLDEIVVVLKEENYSPLNEMG